MKFIPLVVILAVPLAACTTTTAPAGNDINAMLARQLAGLSQIEGKEYEAALQSASEHPLGSEKNPVRAHSPVGQRAYLSRLRCENGEAPQFRRKGSAGISPYGNIVDIYDVECAGSAPAASSIYIDMYHKGYIETQAVDGFTIAGG